MLVTGSVSGYMDLQELVSLATLTKHIQMRTGSPVTNGGMDMLNRNL